MDRRTLIAGLGALAACRRGLPEPDGRIAALARIAPPPDAMHCGFNHAHIHHAGRGYGSASSKEQLRRLADLGCTHVALTPFGYQGNLQGTEITFGSDLDRSLTDDHLAREADLAKECGLAVTLKPHIWSRAFWMGGKSRQDIDPGANWPEWFDRYGDFAEHYAKVAQRIDAAWYTVGLEYLTATLQNPGRWAGVAERVRQHYDGKLTYAANWYREAEAFADWEAFDAIGVNAYYPLTDVDSPDVATMIEGWVRHARALRKLSEQHDRPVLFLEAGCPAKAGAAKTPWDHGMKGAADPELQARYYRALLSTFQGEPWFAGVYWWKSFTHPRPSDDYTPLGRPAERVLAEAWLTGSGERTAPL